MHGLGLRGPDIVLHRSGGLVTAKTFWNIDLIGATLSHGLRQLQEEPMVEFGGKSVISVHRFALPIDSLWRR